MFVLGCVLHFTYGASGGLWIVGIFSAMDESVWEHLKLAFWPGMFWTGFLILNGGARVRNFWIARALALALPPLIIVAGFYGYTAVLDRNLLVLDIGLFLLAVALGQLGAIMIYRTGPMGRGAGRSALALIAILVLAFSTISFLPFESSIFVDHSA